MSQKTWIGVFAGGAWMVSFVAIMTAGASLSQPAWLCGLFGGLTSFVIFVFANNALNELERKERESIVAEFE